MQDAHIPVVVVVIRRSDIGRSQADRAVTAAVVLDGVIADLQVVRIGIGEDRPALGDHAGRQTGRQAANLVDIGREALLVAAAQIKAVDRRRRICAEGRREGIAPLLGT